MKVMFNDGEFFAYYYLRDLYHRMLIDAGINYYVFIVGESRSF